MRREDFIRIHEGLGTPEHVKRHCMAVGDAAVNIYRALADAGLTGLNGDAICLAGYLHDMARAEKDHETLGAAMLKEMDFEASGGFPVSDEAREAAADIITRHMRFSFPDSADGIDSVTVVSLADRTILEDVYIGYKARMDELLRRFAAVPEVVDRVHESTKSALALIEDIEGLVGRPFRDIITGGRVDAAPLLGRVERPGRYIGGEIGSARKEWDNVDFRFCFAFPDLYEIGMSYTGMQIIYGLLNERDDVLCERVFTPAEDMALELSGRGLPLFSLENRMPVNRFDIVGFTLQYELCYTNVIRMLAQADIPLYASKRGFGDPFVIAGGPCCANAEPIAPFFDLICLGDGEEMMPAIADTYIAWKNAGNARPEPDGQGGIRLDREEFLLMCSKIPGVYSPLFYEPVFDEVFINYTKKHKELPDIVSRAVTGDLESAFFPTRPLVSHIESVHDRVSIEIMRGCYRKCLFCQASYSREDVSKRSPELIKKLLFEGLANTGYDEATLLSLSTGDYPGIDALVMELMDKLAGINATLSMPSLRLDSLKEDALAGIAAYKRAGLTFAPEAGTQRLRDAIGKQLTEEDIFGALEICLPLGFRKFKFYFMIGLPGERREDLDGIALLAGRIIKHVKTLGAEAGEKYQISLSISVSNFVPKPGTPLERARGNTEEELIEKIHYLKDAVRKVKGAGFKYHDTRMSRIEMLLAKGDRRMAEVVRLAAERGRGFDSWRESFSYDNWLSAFADAGLPPYDLYAEEGGLELTEGPQPLPWSLIEKGKAYNPL